MDHGLLPLKSRAHPPQPDEVKQGQVPTEMTPYSVLLTEDRANLPSGSFSPMHLGPGRLPLPVPAWSTWQNWKAGGWVVVR